jgi:hypothetical protein
MSTREDIRGHLSGTQKATRSTQGVKLRSLHGGVGSGTLPSPIWRAEALIELSAAQHGRTDHHGIPPSGCRGALPSQKGVVSLVVHGQTIDLSISENAEIHFEDLQLGKTINQIALVQSNFASTDRSTVICIAMLLVSSLTLERLTKT